MRKANVILCIGILVLFLVHGILGGFQVIGVTAGGNDFLKGLTWVLLALVGVHGVIGTKYTVDTLRALKKSGKSYFKENRLFWARRISGFAVMLFVVIHAVIFLGKGSGENYRLNYFGTLQLISQILMVISVAVHVICNIKPLFISLGSKGIRAYLCDILFILSVVMLFCGVAMVIYYLRWNVFWR